MEKVFIELLFKNSPNYRPCLKAHPSCCCDYWRSCIQNIVASEATRIENCELTGTPYTVRI